MGYAVMVAGYPATPDLLNATDRAQPQGHDLGSKAFPVRVEHSRRRQTNSKGQLLDRAESIVEPVAHGFDSESDDIFQLGTLTLDFE